MPEETFDKSGSTPGGETSNATDLVSDMYAGADAPPKEPENPNPAEGLPDVDVPEVKETPEETKKENSGEVPFEEMKENFENQMAEVEQTFGEQITALQETIVDLKSKLEAPKEKESDDDEIPQPPTKTEYETDPDAWFDKKMKYEKYKENKLLSKQQQEQKQLEEKAANKRFWDEQNEIKDQQWDKMLNKYPQIKSQDSQLFKEADKLFLEGKEKGLDLNPYFESHCIMEAAEKLGVDPIRAKRSSQPASAIMQPSPGLGSPAEGEISPSQFDAMSTKEQEAHMYKTYMGRGRT